MALGGRIRETRERRGWKQTELVARVNRLVPEGEKQLSQQALERLEARDSNKSEFAVQLADALGVSVRWLLAGQGDPSDLDWPFPDQELLPRVLRLPRDWRVEVQSLIRDKVRAAEDESAASAGHKNVIVTPDGDRAFNPPPLPAAKPTIEPSPARTRSRADS